MCLICMRLLTWRQNFHATQGTDIELGMFFPSKRHFGGSMNGRDDDVLFLEGKDLAKHGYVVLDSRYFAGVLSCRGSIN